MKIKLTSHAKFRLMERGISIAQLKEVLKSPVNPSKAYSGFLKKKSMLVDTKVAIEVIYKQLTKNEFLVITAYYEN